MTSRTPEAAQPGTSHLRPNSRMVGYGAVLVVGLVVLFLSWRIYVYTQLERDSAWVHFTGSGDLIGSLQEDDPVAIQGVTIGQVEEIRSASDGVRVRLRFWKHQKLWRDATATNLGNGMMGMRFVLLLPGADSLHPLDRNADIPGTFRPGIAEVMSGIQQVVAQVATIESGIHLIAAGDSLHRPLPREVMERVQALDDILGRMESIDRKVDPAVSKLQVASRGSAQAARGLDSTLPSVLAGLRRTDTLLVRSRELAVWLRQNARKGDSATRTVDRTLDPFTRDDSLLRRVESTLVVVDKLQAFLEGRTRVKYNFHIWGDNPSKHGE